MSNIINGVKVPFVPIVNKESTLKNKAVEGKSSFEKLFKVELEKIKFSKHASQRLEARKISLSDKQLEKLNDAVFKAEEKGSVDSLVMMDETAFIVNIPNKTVVTAVQVDRSDENVFTNIDSVVFAT